MSANLGWLFYRDLYAHGDDDAQIGNTMNALLEADDSDEQVDAPHGFKLKTLYPGLLTGSGYAHGISNDQDAKIGVFFDHTSGLPVIPGSSVKGVLRSLFGLPFGKQKSDYRDQKRAMIRQLLEVGKDFDVDALAEAIFEGMLGGEPLGVYERDRFYDARIVKTAGKVLADDYITPHENPLKNPVPIRFLKVPGGVTFAFAFALVDTPVGDTVVTADQKELLFLQLLQTFGVGAKSNVGYGQFEAVDTEAFLRSRALHKAAQEEARHKEEMARKEEEARARMSPLERKFAEVQARDSNANPTTMLFKAIEAGEFDDQWCEALALLRSKMEEAGEWREKSNAKKPQKDKPYQNTLKVMQLMEGCEKK